MASSGSFRKGSSRRGSPAEALNTSFSPQALDRLAIDRAVSTHRTGLRLPDKLGLESWCRIGNQISLITNASAWWLGDWLIYGQESFPDRYKQAMARTSLDYQTLRNYSYVARRFSHPRRRPELSFQHHAEVSGLEDPDQEIWLNRAQTFGWSLHEFRRQLRAAGAKGRDPAATHRMTLILAITPDRYQVWSAAAEQTGQELLEWAAEVLDMASAVGSIAAQQPPLIISPSAGQSRD
jgi:hypothetical protein